MEKSLVRAFLYSLIAFLVLNFLFFVIGYAIDDNLGNMFDIMADHPTMVIYTLVRPISNFPWDIIEFINLVIGNGRKIMYVGYFVSLITASIIAGFSGGDIPKSLGGWFLTSICSIISIIAICYMDAFIIINICGVCPINEAIIEVLITGVTNLLIYGGVTLIIALIVSRS